MAARTLVVEGPPDVVAAFAAELRVGDYSPRVSDGRLTCRLPGQVEFDCWREAAIRRHLTPCQRSLKPTAPILATALRRAKAGDRVVPVAGIADGHCACPRGRGCSRPGKHPLVHDWIAAATTNPATIRGWWSKWSGANLGVTLSDQVAIDIDGPEPEAVLARCLVEHGPLPEGHGHERTGRGRHLVMGCPPGMEAASIPGLDVWSGPHHLLVVAPSIHVSGATYTEVQCRDLQTMAPGWCLRPIPTPAPTPTTAHQIGIVTFVGAEMLQRAMQEVATTPRDGHRRNITLHRWAYTLAGLWAGGRGPGQVEVEEALLGSARICGLVEEDGVRQCRASIGSGWGAGVRRALCRPVLTRDPADIDTLAQIRRRRETTRWPGVGGAVAYLVLGVLLALGERLGTTIVTHSHRQIAEDRSRPRWQVGRAIHWLETQGWLEVLEVGEGRRGSTYRLRLPDEVISDPVGPRGGSGGRSESGPVSVPRPIPRTHDCWLGLPAQAPLVLCRLTAEPAPTVAVSEHIGVGPRQARRVLHSLAQVGLTVFDQGRWRLSDPAESDLEGALDTAAATLGCTGAMDRMRAQHRHEREVYRHWWDGRERALAWCRRTRPTWSRPRSDSVPESAPATPVGARGPP